jgi:ACT domain-containing protein
LNYDFLSGERRTGMKKIVVTVIGADSVGIVAGVTKELALQNINILDISQTILDGIFDMILICDMEKAKGTLKDVQDALGMLGKELGVDVRVQLADIFYAMHRI